MTVTESLLVADGVVRPIPARAGARAGGGAGQCSAAAAMARLHRFTLLELMIAWVVFLFVVTALVAFGREVTRTWGRLHQEQQLLARLLVLDRTLDSILGNAVPLMWPDEDNEPVPAFLGEPDRLRLAYVHSLNDWSDGALRFIGLTLNSDAQFVAVYQERPFFDWDADNETARVSVLAENVQAVEFLYADWVDEEDLEWMDEWDPERKELPLAIMVTLQWQDGRAESWLRRTAGSGYRERWGKWTPAEVMDSAAPAPGG